MRFCIYGAGAIGGYVAVRPALKRFILGEPDRSRSPRVAAPSAALVGAGRHAPPGDSTRNS